jgi:hypothetical protein
MRPFEVAYYRNCHSLFSDQKDSLWKYLDAGYPDRLGPSVKFVENSTKLTCHEITGYPIKYSTALWPLELQMRRGRKL